MWGMWLRRVCQRWAAQAGNTLGLFERNVTFSRMSRALDLNLKRGVYSMAQEKNLHSRPAPIVRSYSGVPGHKPTPREKKILLWAGRFKKEEDIPEIISHEMIDAAKNRVRVKISYIMIALSVMGCIAMVISGKRAASRNESLTIWNIEKKARLKDETQKEQVERSN
ncbi:protein FAM162A [Microcaecilia unicolor]|uniref:Protein FAM162A n=1 Tax=Microcaecilia unicolor TaxID=1415580 RepID=A0A6P7Y414_9AMPH|nr:protein FAM162A [Microcaecilia unicolor]